MYEYKSSIVECAWNAFALDDEMKNNLDDKDSDSESEDEDAGLGN